MTNNTRNIIIAVVVVVLIVAGVSFLPKSISTKYKNLDQFAQCLTDKGMIMYGAYWCSHCAAQKRLFGDSFKNVTYVECTEEADRCNAAGVQGYPTWELASTTLTGEQTLETLAELSGCLLELKE